MNLKDLIGGGLDPRKFTRVDINTSQNFVVQKTGWHLIVLSGGGGSGASGVYGFGGAGGNFKAEWHYLTKDDVHAVSIGAGGASVTDAEGNNGGDSTFGTLITSLGGEKGIYSRGGKSNTGDGGSPGQYDYRANGKGGDFRMNIYNILLSNQQGGKFLGSTHYTSGGGAGIAGNGGDSPSTSMPGNDGDVTAGGSGAYKSITSGAGGDGLCYVFYEA